MPHVIASIFWKREKSQEYLETVKLNILTFDIAGSSNVV